MISIPKHNFPFAILIIISILTGCEVRSSETTVTTATPVSATATPSPTPAPLPSGTPLPTHPQPTVAPVEGVSSTQLNVRSEPSTAGNVLGIIPANTKMEIIGKDPGGNWWQILYPAGVDGKGWVTAQYVTTANQPEVPVVGGGGAGLDNGNIAIVRQQINVRSGPATNFNSLGTLNAQDVVNLTGKDSNGAWLQIAFPTGPDGKGWVNAAFVQATGVENLPIVTEAGQVVGTGTPTGSPLMPTPTIVPARMDDDSQTAPAVSIAFEPLGTRVLIYGGDVSTPKGDAQDWVQFSPHNKVVFASLECNGSGTLEVSIFENGLPAALDIKCGEQLKPLPVQAGSAYLIRLGPPQATDGLQYTSYTLTIQSNP